MSILYLIKLILWLDNYLVEKSSDARYVILESNFLKLLFFKVVYKNYKD